MRHPLKRLTGLLISLSLTSFSFTQTNLVPNWSFEQYDTCPNAGDQIQHAIGWSKFSNSNSTPDYYNSCAPSSGLGVPKSFACYQAAHRNCNAYAGIIIWGAAGNDREYIGIQLSQPLSIGQKYFISFYAVLSGYFFGGNYYDMPSNNIGIRLSTVAYSSNNPCPISNWAHINYSSVLNDSVNWARISGSVVADSLYKYIIVGNFFDDGNTTTTPYACGTCLNVQSYYFIDDVCLSTDSMFCNGGIDTLSCITFVNDNNFKNDIRLYPNPAINSVEIEINNPEPIKIVLSDIYGNIIYKDERVRSNIFKINLDPYSSGVYFLKVIDDNKKTSTIKKIIKL